MNLQVENTALHTRLSKIVAPICASTKRFQALVVLAMAAFFAGNAMAITKAATGTDLTAGASWTGNSAPGSGDVATWITGSLGPGLTLASGQEWYGVAVTNATAAVGITGVGTLTLGAGGMDLLASSVDLTIATPVALVATQDWKVNTSRTLTASGSISGSSYGLAKLGSGTLILTGANSYTGPTTITLGTLQIGNIGTSGSLSPSSAISNNGTLTFKRTDTLTQGTDFANVISGSGQVIDSGSGTLIFNSNNTYTGTTTLGGGNTSVLSINSLKAAGVTCSLGQGSQINFGIGAAGGILRYTGLGNGIDGEGTTDRVFSFTGNATIGTLDQSGLGLLKFTGDTTVTGAASTQTKTLTLTGSSVGTGEFAGVIQNGANGAVLNVTKSGTGLWVLSGANTYTGLTTLASGTLVVGNNNALGGGGFQWENTGTLQANTPVTITNFVTLSGNSHHGYFTGTNSVTLNGNMLTTGGAGFTIHNMATGSAVLTLAGNSISVNDGVARTLGLDGTGNTLVTGNIVGTGGNVALNATAGAGTVTLNGTNTYTGTTTVSYGRVVVNGIINSTNAVAVNNSAYLIVNGSLKSNSVVTLSTSAYLGGTGTVNGAVSLLNNSGIDLRNSSAGTLTLSTNLNISGGSGANNLYFDLGTGGNGDKITVAGNTTVTTDGAGVVNMNQLNGSNLGGIGAGTYDLIATTGSMAPLSKFSLATPGAAFGKTYSLQLDGTTKKLQTVVAGGNAGDSVSSVFWKGSTAIWNTAQWYSDSGASTTANMPGYNGNVVFAATTPANLNTTLGQDFEINSLTVNSGVAATTIAGHSLTIDATSTNSHTSGDGITVNNSAGTTISSKVGLGTNQTWTVTSGAALTVSGAVSDFGYGYSIAKLGIGTLALNGANTFSGGLSIKAGTVNLGNGAGAGNPAGTIYLGDADLDANVTLSINCRVATMNANPISVVSGNTGTVTLNFAPGGNTGYVNGLITLNTHDLIVTTVGGYNNQINGGITGTGNLTFAETVNGSIVNVKSGTIDINGNIIFNNSGTAGTQIAAGGTATLNNTGAITNISTSTGLITIAGSIGSNVTAIVQNSANSTMILSGVNNFYAGTTTVSAGTLEIGTSSSLGPTSSVIIATSAKMYLNFSGTNTVKSLKLGNTFKSKGVYNVTTDSAYFTAGGAGSLNVTTGPAVGTVIRFF